MAAPKGILELAGRGDVDEMAVLLTRTIGVRDLVLGAAAVGVARGRDPVQMRRWVQAGMASDILDAAVGMLSGRRLGWRDSTIAAGSGLAFVGLDLLALRSLDRAGRR